MDNLISLDKFIELAQQRHIDFGKGNPYNRLRYYTKIGWLPHMIRKTNPSTGEVAGHYDLEALETFTQIESLKKSGKTNAEITSYIKKRSHEQHSIVGNLKTLIISKKFKYIVLALLALL